MPLSRIGLGADPNGALEGPLPRVGADVRGQVVLGRHHLGAEVTPERSVPRVYPHVS